MRFWDASALIPLCVREAASPAAEDLLRKDPGMVVWWGSRVECWSALCRRRREGTLGPDGEHAARMVLQALCGAWVEVKPTDAVRTEADRILRHHALRAADALQLAAARLWAVRLSSGRAALVCYDARLRQAAGAEGLEVLPAVMP